MAVKEQTFGDIELATNEDGEEFWKITRLDTHVIIKLKTVFSKIKKTARVPFILKNTLENSRDMEWFLHRYPLEMSYDDKQILHGEAEQHRKTANQLESFFDLNYKAHEVKLKDGKALRNYQGQFVEIYDLKKRMILGDKTGIGKTISGIGTMLLPGRLPTMVVMQPHLQNHWEEKINEFTDLKVHKLHGRKPYELPEADVYLMKYSCIAGWMDVFMKPFIKNIVFDEVQELRRSESAKYRASKAITEYCENALGMSATPVYNYGDEIFNILDLLNPGCLGDRSSFLREWCGWGDRVEDPKALGSFLRKEHLMLRRTREEVGRELPPVNKIIHTVGYDKKAMDAIEARAEVLAVKALSGSFIERGQASRDLDIMVRHATGVSKAKGVAEYVDMLLESGEKVLLAGWHRDVYKIWNKILTKHNPVMYTGSESQKQKDEAKRKFIEGESDLMIISLRSGIGLDGLQEVCKVVVLGELDWSPGVHEQISGRINRDRTDMSIQTMEIYLVSDSGSDPVIMDMLGVKASQAAGIHDPFLGVQKKHSDDSNIKKLAQSYAQGSKLYKEQVTGQMPLLKLKLNGE